MSYQNLLQQNGPSSNIFLSTQVIIIHGLQKSILDIKRRIIDFKKEVFEEVEKLNRNKNGNLFLVSQTDYPPQQVFRQKLRGTIDFVNRNGIKEVKFIYEHLIINLFYFS